MDFGGLNLSHTKKGLFGKSIRGWSMHLHFYCEGRGVSPTPIPTVLHNWIGVARFLPEKLWQVPVNPKKLNLWQIFFITKKRCRLKNLSLFLMLKAPSGMNMLTAKPCHPPVKTRERDCRPSECCHQAQGKILRFFRLPKAKKRTVEKNPPVRKIRNAFFFRREIGNQTHSQPILYLRPILNQFSMPKLFLQPILYLGKNDSLFKSPNLNQKKGSEKLSGRNALKNFRSFNEKLVFCELQAEIYTYIYMYLLYPRTLVDCFPHQVYLCLRCICLTPGDLIRSFGLSLLLRINPFIWPTFFGWEEGVTNCNVFEKLLSNCQKINPSSPGVSICQITDLPFPNLYYPFHPYLFCV